ncbi:MAG TPA: ABC transporter substrate-binding protein, partial [Limnochordia bacterium]|nr:ABC transporter substrate-binding protein [Limnochordia bacterium]
MWGNRNRKAAILTTMLLAFVLAFGIISLPHLVGAQADNDPQAVAAEDSAAEVPDGDDSIGSATAQLTAYKRAITYPEYLAQYPDAVRPDREILIPAVSLSNLDAEIKLLYDFEGMPGISVQTGERGYVEWEIEVEEAGLYNIEITYYPVPGRSASVQRAVAINGVRPFSEAGYIVLHRSWGDAGPIEVDIYGNQLRPRQIEIPRWNTAAFVDPAGYERFPFLFYFKEGTNTIRLEAVSEALIIHSLRVFQYEKPLPYTEVKPQYEASGYKPTSGVFIQIEGEAAAYRSSPTIMPVHDVGDPTVVPYHPSEIRLNSIGGTGWKAIGDWAAWEIDVPESGLYQIAIKGKQDQRRGIYTSRQLKIDGKVPFMEADALRFRFDNRYEMVVPTTDDGETALVYLEAGKHELTLTAVLGDVSGLVRRIENLIYDLNTIYRRIIMITSGQPDPLRSYQLDQKIPGLIPALREQAAVLRSVADEFEAYTGQKGGHVATLTSFARVLEDMAERPHAIPSLLGEYRDNVGSMGTWLNQTIEQPVQIDFIIIASPDQKLPNPKPTALQTWMHEIRAFLASFTYDYTRVGDRGLIKDTDEVLRVWIGSGRDQAQALKQMIEDSFTPETGIPVDMELIQSMDSLIIPSIIAGTAPDVALGASNMDLAFRNALADLRQFEDFDEVAQRFMKSAFV